MKDKIFGVLQRVGRSFMLPIALLPVAGLLLGIGGSFTNQTTIESFGWSLKEGDLIYTILSIMNAVGDAVFSNLPLLFAIGVAIGMAKKEKEVAALSGAIGFIVMNVAIQSLIKMVGENTFDENAIGSVLGITTLKMGVFGGVIVGLGVAALHNKFYKIKLPTALSFFGGTRFVPIITTIVYLLVGVLMFFIWPFIGMGIGKLGGLVQNTGYIGTWIYGIIERALIPFGLHHVFYMPFWQTNVGGTAMVGLKEIAGAQNIFFAELADKSTTVFNVEATRFMAGKFPFMIFGLPAAAFAMYKAARPEKKKLVGGLLFSAALTSFLTGITEPIEFTFLFVAPLMYGVHCVLAGLSYMLMHICHVGVGVTFSGGVIDLTLFGILQGNSKTNWIWVIFIGLIYAAVYYFVFYTMITKFNYKTPGREDDGEETKLYTRADVEARKAAQNDDNVSESAPAKDFDKVSALITKGLGGKANLSDVDCCATRLRVTVVSPELVADTLLRESGASGVIHKGNGVQVIYGPQVAVIKSNLEDFLETPDAANVDALLGNVSSKPVSSKIVKVEAEVPKNITLFAHMDGQIVNIEDVEDDAFSAKMLGDGIAIEPVEGKLFAPCDGTIEMIFDTKHAVNIVSTNGCELLLHIGIDTVKLNGKYFEVHVAQGQKIKKGDLLISFDMNGIKSEGFKLTTPVIICNTDKYASITPVASGEVNAGQKLLEIK